jgi:hypothetical protein
MYRLFFAVEWDVAIDEAGLDCYSKLIYVQMPETK